MGFGKFLRKIASVALPIAASFIPGVGPLASAALTAGAGALGTKIGGGSWGDALKMGALSGLGSFIAPTIGKAFSSQFPETAAALGIGQSGGLAQISGLANPTSSGLAQGAKSAVNYGTTFGPAGGTLPWQAGYTATALPWQTASSGGLSAIADAIPTTSSIMDFAKDNALPLALGAASLMSSADQTDPNAASQRLLDEQKAKDAEQSALWSGVINSNDVNRTQTDTSGIDWNNYGSGGSNKFFDNVNPTKQYAEGGKVERDSDRSRYREQAMRTRARMDDHPMRDQIDFTVGRYMDSDYPGTIDEYMNSEYGDVPLTRAMRGAQKLASGAMSDRQRISDNRRIAAVNAAQERIGRSLDEVEMQNVMSMLNSNKNFTTDEIADMAPNVQGKKYARGGRVTGALKAKTGGQEDLIDIKAAGGEFVIPADVVAHLGDGNTDAGAGILKGMMEQVRKHKTGNIKMPKPINKSKIKGLANGVV